MRVRRSKARKCIKGWYPRRYSGTLRRASDSENVKTTRNEARKEGWCANEGGRDRETDRERETERERERGEATRVRWKLRGCAGGARGEGRRWSVRGGRVGGPGPRMT